MGSILALRSPIFHRCSPPLANISRPGDTRFIDVYEGGKRMSKQDALALASGLEARIEPPPRFPGASLEQALAMHPDTAAAQAG